LDHFLEADDLLRHFASLVALKLYLAFEVGDFGLLPADLALEFFLNLVVLALDHLGLAGDARQLIVHFLELALHISELGRELRVVFSR